MDGKIKRYIVIKMLELPPHQGYIVILIAEYIIGAMLLIGKRSIANYLSTGNKFYKRTISIQNSLDLEILQTTVGIWGCGDIGKL